MAAPLILRIITDATQTLRANESVIASNTLVGKSGLDMGASLAKGSQAAIASSLALEDALAAQAVKYRELSTSASLSSREQAKAAQFAALSEEKLARSQGLFIASSRGVSSGAKTAERDLGKLTRGALAGSGVISALGRSLAFASTGFIVVAGTATILHNAITEALGFAQAEKQVAAQLKTSGLSFEQSKSSIDSYLTSESKLSGFTRQELLQSFGSLVRVSGNVGQSLKLDSVAADVARGRHIALSSASIALAKALGGSSTALRRLGIIVPKTATGMAAIEFVSKKFAGQAEAGATSADHLHASLANTGEVIGTAVLPTFNRLVGEFSNYLTKLQASGELQRDANFLFARLGDIFHTLEAAIRAVDDVTGGFVNTIAILIGLELGSKIYGWIKALRVLAGTWGLVGAAAVTAGEEQAAAVTVGGAAGAGGAAAGAAGAAEVGGIGGLLTGGLLGKLVGSRARGYFASRAAAGAIGEGVAGGAAVGVSATGIGALAVAALFATKALDSFVKKIGDSLGAGSNFNEGVDVLAGVLSGGIVGEHRAGIIGLGLGALGVPGFTQPKGPPPPTPQQLQAQLIPTNAELFGPKLKTIFGGAQPMTQFWKAWKLSFTLQMSELQDALTKGNADDVATARKIVASIKKQIDEGVLKGPALQQALQAEASALSTIWSAEAAAAQKRATAAAAAKQKIITQIQNAIDPIKLEVALSKAQALGQDTTPRLKALLAAAYKGLAKAIAANNDQLIKQAYDQITSLKQQIKDAQTTAAKTFTEPLKLQIALARAQAFGGDTTSVLKQMKAAALKALHSGKYAGQSLIDLLNEIANINNQLGSSTTNAYGDYKKASVKALTANLGLTPDQRRRLEQRYSQVGPGGTVPETGTGAAGYIIDPTTGRPVRVTHPSHRSRHRASSGYGYSGPGGGVPHIGIDLNVYIDGHQVEASVTRNQQRRRRHNPTQTRGPNAATSVA